MQWKFVASLALWTLAFGKAAAAVEPNAVYDGGFNSSDSSNSSILLRIGNGGAGQSGLVKALADAFIQESVKNGSEPFKIAWITSDNTFTINYLETGDVDVGITYVPTSEQIAVDRGIATARHYIFRDHFIFVGPPSNPANISKDDDIVTIFSDLRATADDGEVRDVPVRFLSRYDKSATNIKESSLFLSIGQAPWSTAYSTWYHQYIAFPIQALTAAIILQEYTLTDRGTYLSLDTELSNRTTIYKAATDDADDPLLNPAHLLVGAKAADPEFAESFADWVVGASGQNLITAFAKNGEILYSGAPAETQAKKRHYQ